MCKVGQGLVRISRHMQSRSQFSQESVGLCKVVHLKGTAYLRGTYSSIQQISTETNHNIEINSAENEKTVKLLKEGTKDLIFEGYSGFFKLLNRSFLFYEIVVVAQKAKIQVTETINNKLRCVRTTELE